MSTTTVNYSAAAPITSTSLVSLPTSSTFVAGAELTAQNNASNKYVDALVTGLIRVGTTPTINTLIVIYAFAALDETPTWPDVFDGTDSTETLTSVGLGQGFLKRAATLNVDATTSDRYYPFSFALAELFGGIMPRDWSLFITHNTGVNLNASGSYAKYQGIKYDAS